MDMAFCMKTLNGYVDVVIDEDDDDDDQDEFDASF